MSSDPATSADTTSIDQGIERIQERLTQLGAAQTSIRRWSVAMIVLLTAQSLLFAWALYGTVRDNFLDKQKVVAAITPRLEALYPSFQAEALNIISDVGPVYTGLAAENLRSATPALIDNLETEIRSLATDLHTDLRKSLEISLNRVAKRIEPDIQATFPALMDQDALDRLSKQFENRVYEEFGQLGTRFDTIYQTEARKIWNALLAVSPQEAMAADKLDLQRNLLHHVIMLADYELLHAGEPDSATEVFLQLFDVGDPHAQPTAQ
ncbi:MAG: hypothetical protein HC898_01425 [Phycisphaerales bacterium]|nr:hypothetical protein [Phycisphaerales bacterium]